MPRIDELKARLEELPRRLDERHLAEDFTKYTQKISSAYEKLGVAWEQMNASTMVNGNSAYKSRVLPELKNAAREAFGLHETISENAAAVKKKATENAIIRVGDYAEKAKQRCKETWAAELESNAIQWEKIASVFVELGAHGGQEFKKAVHELTTQQIPSNETDVKRVKQLIEKLQKGIQDFGLEGAFGRFLEATAGTTGASLRDLSDEEVQQQLTKHDLWDSFRIRVDVGA